MMVEPNEPQMMILSSSASRRGGRPATYGKRMTRRLVIRTTDDQIEDLKSVAADEGHRDVSVIVREAVDEYVSDYRERKVFGKARYSPE